MPYSPATYEEKPYNRCIDCKHIGKDCDGPNFLAMEISRLCEWARFRKAYKHSKAHPVTNAIIADVAQMSKTTVDRFMSGDIEDLKFSTAARIIKVLVDGTWGQYPCTMASMSDPETVYVDDPATLERCKQLQEETDFLKARLLQTDKLMNERYSIIKRKDKIITFLGSLLGIALIIIIAALTVDMLHPNIGFFWRQ